MKVGELEKSVETGNVCKKRQLGEEREVDE